MGAESLGKRRERLRNMRGNTAVVNSHSLNEMGKKENAKRRRVVKRRQLAESHGEEGVNEKGTTGVIVVVDDEETSQLRIVGCKLAKGRVRAGDGVN